MVHLIMTWRFMAAVAVSVGFGVRVLRKRHSRNQPRLSPEEIRATAGFVAEQRQRQHEERQRRRAARRNEGWTTPGPSGSNNLAAPSNTANAQQQPPRQQTPASPSGERNGSFAPSGSNTTENPLWFPPQYVPSGGEIQSDLSLHTHEVVRVLDSGLTAHPGNAILDTGNAGCTLITNKFACQLGLVDFDGNPTQAYLSRTRVQGVVAGAHEMLKRINIQYEIKGKRVRCVAGLKPIWAVTY